MLSKMPSVFSAGEMLDWEAPTRGFLLTACFATGRAAGEGALNWLRSNKSVTLRLLIINPAKRKMKEG